MKETRVVRLKGLGLSETAAETQGGTGRDEGEEPVPQCNSRAGSAWAGARLLGGQETRRSPVR